jgi:Sulfotransferase family
MRYEPIGRTVETQQLLPIPIIVGTPRSGTTLLRFMLDAHPQLAIPPETGFFWIAPELNETGDRLREQFFNAVINYPPQAPAWADFEIPAEVFWSALQAIDPFNSSEGFRAFYRLYAARLDKPRFGDKTPIYCKSLDLIRTLLPEARFIHLIRDGRDVALSLRRMWFSPGSEMKTQAAYWRDCVLAARQNGIGRRDYLEVRYEDLVLNTRTTLERVCQYIELSFDEAMLSYHTRAPTRLEEHKGRWNKDGSILLPQELRLAQQRRSMEPPDPTCVFAWKTAMTFDERKDFELVAGDLLQELGYEV